MIELGPSPYLSLPVHAHQEMMTSLQIKWPAVRFILYCLFLMALLPMKAHSHDLVAEPGKILDKHHQAILALASDKEAIQFHQRFMPTQPPSSQTHSNRRRSQPSTTTHAIPTETESTITAFWAALATIGYVREFRTVPKESFSKNFFRDTYPSETQRDWLRSKHVVETFATLLKIHDAVSTWTPQTKTKSASPNLFSQFDTLYDHIDATTHTQVWIRLLHQLGFDGIQLKLEEYWQAQNQQELSLTSDPLKQPALQHYIESRLLPLFHTHLLTQATQVEAQAMNVAWTSWNHIQEWQQEQRTLLSMNRLCGKWKWIIHNHQNHGDHKTTMTFSKPGQAAPTQMQPSSIHIHGDTVFLKWTFPQGTQEDSLLMSNRDTRLEGTFINSLGPHGSISGKRLSACQK